jgi:hypothetical protein
MKSGDGGVLSNIVQLLLQDILNKIKSNVSSLQAVQENSCENMQSTLMNLFIANLQQK